MKYTTRSFKHLLLLSAFIFIINNLNGQTMYWVGGSGDWNDLSHWSKNSGNLGTPTGALPNTNNDVVFDNNSGLTNATVTIPPGNWNANSFIVLTSNPFEIEFDGSNGNFAAMNIYGDLTLQFTSDLTYNAPSIFNNVWRFVGSNQQDINTGNQDLSSVEFVNGGTTYNQVSHLKASERVKMFGGTWNTNNRNVNCGTLLFQDNNSSNNPITKIFNAGTSNIICDLWSSKFTYQSLTVNGDYSIYTKQFQGSPGNQFLSFSFNDIYLLDFVDNSPGGFSQIEHNNFDCSYCTIENLIISDTSRIQLAGVFTVNGALDILNLGTSILFNGGNGRDSEVTFNGSIKTPKVTDCDDVRPKFSNVYNDFSIFIRTSGSLKINDSEIKNIQAQGGATFTAVNTVLQGSSSGWNISNPPNPLSYEWIGVSGTFSDWNNPANWQLVGGGYSGCIPTIVDDVFITNAAKGDISVPYPIRAKCRNFTWTNTKNLELKLDGGTSVRSELLIAGNFELDASATISTINYHDLIFSSTSTNYIITNGVVLPDIYFVGDAGTWELADDLVCTEIDIEGGTIETQNNDITTASWRSLEDNPKHFILGSSTITVYGEMKLAELPDNNVTVDKGTSLIRCELLTSAVPELYDVEMINTNNVLMDNWPVEFNKLILSGSGSVGNIHHMTLNDLVFNVDASELQVHTFWDFKIIAGIQSNAAKSNPGILNSRTPGTRAEVQKDDGNLCVEGYINIKDIKAVLPGVMHAPLSKDLGNDTLIVFDGGGSNSHLFWTGGTNNSWNTVSNWSYVSGGCPSNKSPASSPNLIFDDNSFFEEANAISLSSGSNTTANDVYFYNKEELTITSPQNFIPDNISVIGGDVRFEGATVEVQGETYVGPETGYPGLLITDMTNVFRTFSFSGEYGIWIVRSGSQAIIVDP